jgi:pimeloyl-ACP methyl ester carboxylesterase
MNISISRTSNQSVCNGFNALSDATNELKTDLSGRLLWRPVVALLFALTIPSAQLHAQLVYDHTSFLNGFGSDSTIWMNSYADLQTTPPAYLGQQVVLQTPAYPNVDRYKRYSGQVGDIATYLTQGGHHVLVGHSLGSLVARGTYIDNPGIRPDMAAIVALTAPHQGAPLADNFVTLRSFLRDMQRRIDDAKTAVAIEAAVLTNVFSMFFPGKRTTGLGPSMAAFLIINNFNIPIDVSNLDQFGTAPAFADLSPDSTAITHLNAFHDDGAIPRANIYGTIPFRNAALRLYESSRDMDGDFSSLVTWRNIGQSAFSACKWIGYVTIIQWTLGRRCAYARKVLSRLDDRWVKYVNGSDANGNPRQVPFDGVVPNERSVYPSTNALAFQGVAQMTNHLNVYKTRAGLDQAVNGMFGVGMQRVGGGTSVSGTIAGPTTVRPNVSCLWSVTGNGGTPPYSYHWVNPSDGSGQYYSYANSGSAFMLTVVVTDATQASTQVSKHISLSSSAPLCAS